MTRHADVVDVNRETESMSSARFGNMIFDNPPTGEMGGMLVSMDPPQHTRYRRLINKGFTPRMVSELESTMRKRTREIIDRVAFHVPLFVERRSRDPSDDMFLDLARTVGAAFLLTGDRDLLDLAPHYARRGLAIVGPADFLAAVGA